MLKKIVKKFYFTIKKIIIQIKLKKILIRDERKAIFLIGSPLHGNIGDHAISIAERKLLENIKDKLIIEIPGEYYNLCYKEIKKVIKEDDIILITGGGFIGSLWINEEMMVRHIIENFNNKIVIMPQTIFFSDNDTGRKEFEISKKIYDKHPNLWICAREENTFNYCKKHFNKAKDVFLVPDIVTYLDFQLPKEERNGVLFCLREDKEKIISEHKMNEIISEFRKMKLEVKNTTTVIKSRIPIENRKKVFENKLMEFKKSKIVITDRLHGMIFAAITATPCIAMDNLSGKVKGVYKWLKDLGYIKFVTDIEAVIQETKELIEIENCYYKDTVFKAKFNEILEVLSE